MCSCSGCLPDLVVFLLWVCSCSGRVMLWVCFCSGHVPALGMFLLWACSCSGCVPALDAFLLWVVFLLWVCSCSGCVSALGTLLFSGAFLLRASPAFNVFLLWVRPCPVGVFLLWPWSCSGWGSSLGFIPYALCMFRLCKTSSMDEVLHWVLFLFLMCSCSRWGFAFVFLLLVCSCYRWGVARLCPCSWLCSCSVCCVPAPRVFLLWRRVPALNISTACDQADARRTM